MPSTTLGTGHPTELNEHPTLGKVGCFSSSTTTVGG